MELLIEKLKGQQNRKSTAKTYLCIWRQFNNFIIRLDEKPKLWEDRVSLFIAKMIEDGKQSSSVKSYVSAIKRTLVDDGYPWDDKKVLLNCLTKACKLVNDSVQTRLPIQCGLLELILLELKRWASQQNQAYLEKLYSALFILGYYGLMRAGELTITQEAQHTLKAKDIHLALNKKKLLIVLHSSKTHSRGMRPQKIKITGLCEENCGRILPKRNFCPFVTLNNYIEIRGSYDDENEPFFIFSDRSPVTAINARDMLREMIKRLGLNESLYQMHGLRSGRASDLILKYNYSIDQVKRAGRWRSGAVYKYIKIKLQ